MTLRLLFGLHAVITFAAGVVLVVAPEAIPRTVGIRIEPAAYLLCYLLAAAEFCVAVVSWGARTISNRAAVRVIVAGIIVLHATSAMLEIKAVTAGLTTAIWGNVALRALAIGCFGYYGLYRDTRVPLGTAKW